MKRYFDFAWPPLLVISLCGLLYWFAYLPLFDKSSTQQPAQAMALQASPEPSATPTPSPVPTVDYSAVWPAETAARAADDLANAQARIANAASTQAQATRQGLEHALLIGTPTALEMTRVSGIATEQAQAKAQAVYIEQETARLMAAIEADKQAAENAAILDLIIRSGVAIITIAVIIGAVVIIVYRSNLSAWHKATEGAADNLLDNLEPVAEIAPAPNQVNLSPREAHQFETGIKAAEMAILRRAAIELGGRLSRPTMTPKYFTDPRWREIDDVLCEVRNRADTPDGWALATRRPNQPTFLTVEGWQWLGVKPPTALPSEKSPETNPNAAILQPTQPNQPPEVAGGVDRGGQKGRITG